MYKAIINSAEIRPLQYLPRAPRQETTPWTPASTTPTHPPSDGIPKVSLFPNINGLEAHRARKTLPPCSSQLRRNNFEEDENATAGLVVNISSRRHRLQSIKTAPLSAQSQLVRLVIRPRVRTESITGEINYNIHGTVRDSRIAGVFKHSPLTHALSEQYKWRLGCLPSALSGEAVVCRGTLSIG